MFMLNGSPLALDTPFKSNDIQYPANWLRMTTLEEKEAIGITEVADPASYDDRYYWGVGIPKQLEDEEITPEDGQPYTQTGLKSQVIAQIKQTAGSLLAPTDWKVIRATETGIPLDADTLTARANIRAASNINEAAVAACTTVDELAALQLTWPEIENV
jgi:hypothetical protein